MTCLSYPEILDRSKTRAFPLVTNVGHIGMRPAMSRTMMTRTEAKQAIKRARGLSTWLAFLAIEGDFPSYPAVDVHTWIVV